MALPKLNLYPVIMAKKGAKFPEKGTFFVIAANGAFVRKDLHLFEGLVSMPLNEVPGTVKVGYSIKTSEGTVYVQKSESEPEQKWNKDKDEDALQIVNPNTGELMGETVENLDQRLLSVEPYINMNLPKLPQEIIYNALLFFRKVYNKFSAEAIVLLAYNEAKEEYKLFCPKQKVSGGHITYDRELSERLTTLRENEDKDWRELLESGYIRVGSIHSHCDFQAYHSGVDTEDESSFNGVHITLGHVIDQEFSVASSLALNNYREEVDIENVALGIQRVGNKKSAQSAYISSGRQNYYQIDIENTQKQILKDRFETIIEDWMNKVSSLGKTIYQSENYGWNSGQSYGQCYDDPTDIDGTTYSLVNKVWVKDPENRKSESDEYKQWWGKPSEIKDEYSDENYKEWLEKHPEIKDEDSEDDEVLFSEDNYTKEHDPELKEGM